jgi:hypothetical protein
MLQSDIRASGSTLDRYGPRISWNLGKFVVANFCLCEFGGKSKENHSEIPKFMININV